MVHVLSILFLLVAHSQASPLDGREELKDREDGQSWSGAQSWDDKLNWETPTSARDQKGLEEKLTQKTPKRSKDHKGWEDKFNWETHASLKDQKGWEDEVDLEHKGWDSLSDSTFPGDNHEWARKRRSSENSENGVTLYQYRQASSRENMETAEVNAIFLPAKFRLKKKAAHQLCRRMWERYEGEKRRPSHSNSNPIVPSWSCNDFCCYLALS